VIVEGISSEELYSVKPLSASRYKALLNTNM